MATLAQPPSTESASIPYPVRLRFMTIREIDRAMSYWDRKSQDAHRMQDTEAMATAERRIEAIWAEYDYRDARKAERERRKQCRMELAASLYNAGMGIRS